ncbi:FAD-binding and (Fe-S)-binding domain-containing protein [Tundrisphaera sp. TA3]|uniref:FAD-binding and (Fe-S)-binding domain-containing protein n=1 Tax=Tundrisphaera sp. TA3 TaxID=3435775 RepID=UPI003EB98175
MTAATSRLRDRLSRETTAEVLLDEGSRWLYATDASLYQIEPLGVVVPRTGDDLAAAVRIAFEEGVPIVPRGAATSLSGQTIGEGLVLDLSKYLNRIGIVDRDRMTVKVEPGVVLDRLNAHLRPLGLMFGPDVSTGDRATLGGMIGNNSAGARSLKYGKVVDHVRSLDVVLDDGTRTTFGPTSAEDLDRICRQDDRVGRIHRSVRDTVARHRAAIEARFPKILRRVSGYNLDELVPGLARRAPGWVDGPWAFNLARLIVGSEGTLAVIASAEVNVVPIPPAQGLVILSFASIPAALDRLNEIIATGPAAVEMVDRMMLDLAARNRDYARSLSFASGRPEAILAAQFYADSAEELADRAGDLARRFEGQPGVLGVRQSLSESAKDDFWKIRKAGVSLLMGMVGDHKPVAFVEDTAVAPEVLPAFYDRFAAILARHGTHGACYGHADVGCLHIRPVLNVKTAEGVETLREISREVSDLVVEFGGSMSGEHGDGLARSIWNRKLFGDEVYAAFGEVKHAFDPRDRMNPGKVVAEPDPGASLRIGPTYHAVEPEEVLFDFDAQGGFARAAEMCSGVGACRKNGGGTMCPSYMVTLDERHTTRARANALRLVLDGTMPADNLDHPALREALDLCLQCKACKTECPSNVDMSKLKAEVLHQSYKGRPVPLGVRLMAYIFRLNPIGSATAPLANATLRSPAFRWLMEKLARIDRRRTLPTFESNHLRKWFKAHTPDPRAGSRGKVILLDDCFTTYNSPDVGRAAVRVLEASGYTVELAGLPCCGRPAISKGLLTLGRDLARENVRRLVGAAREGTPILGCEPSCLLTLVDEYRDFRLGPDADLVAASARMVDSFIADREAVPDLPLTAGSPEKVLLHGHCQQKALVGTAGTLAALRRVEGLEVSELDSGCCGMAGSFGYELGHYEVSEALANRVLLPALAKEPGTRLVAPGFSCRSQVHGLAGVDAVHPLELIASRLAPPEA